MKIAVLSDIHGNLAALEAVLADAALRGVDQIVNLGDILSGPLFPSETADRLMRVALPTIRGNHERQLLTYAPGRMGLSDAYAASNLRTDQRVWLDQLEPTSWLALDILMVHGTPSSDLDYFLHTVTPEGLREATPSEILERAGGVEARLVLCGHTHLPRTVRLENGMLIVNPGSVGLQAYDDELPFPHVIETGSPHARYAVVSEDRGDWQAELLSVDYDWEGAARIAQSRGRDDWATALRWGRMHPGREG